MKQLLLPLLLVAGATTAAAFEAADVQNLLFAAMNSRNEAIMAAVETLRAHGVLTPRPGTILAAARASGSPGVLVAAELLVARGLLSEDGAAPSPAPPAPAPPPPEPSCSVNDAIDLVFERIRRAGEGIQMPTRKIVSTQTAGSEVQVRVEANGWGPLTTDFLFVVRDCELAEVWRLNVWGNKMDNWTGSI